ncbi:putative secreted glycosidase [Cladobotryum mycophilum]|uniref:Secreted glycosidase n=1 Tax=Cladobotryum mycophilum TaxID=491253 RepID=A0ABR0T4I4_9HYPO
MRILASYAVWALLPMLVASSSVDYSQYVNPFIGGQGPYEGLGFGGGNIWVGAARPFGVTKIGIDTYDKNVSFAIINGGWSPKGYVTGVSMMHESGTGGAPKYGIISQMPLTTIDAPVNVLDNRTYWQPRVGNDIARVGYFKTSLENGVDIELSAARHSGIIQYSFPKGEKHVLVDVSHYLPSETALFNNQYFVGGDIKVDGSQYAGSGTYIGSFSESAPFTVYFCGEFESKPDEAKTFRGRNTDPIRGFHTFSNGGTPQPTFSKENSQEAGPLNDRVGAVFSWKKGHADKVKSKVGISFMDTHTACKYKDQEISSWDLHETETAAIKEWNDDVFSKIRVPTDESANRTNLALLYSSLYFTHLMPSDRSGENPLWKSDEPYWDDFYTLWDIFRCTTSLYHLIQPSRYEGMIRSLIDIWRWEGYMPDGRSGNYNGIVQGGSNADNVLADAYVKGLRGHINWTDGYQAMVKNAEVVPYNTFTPKDPTGSLKEGRGALTDWLELGYLSVDRSTRSISRTVEYAANDYALSVVAAGEAPQDVHKYLNRSANWQNLWNDNATSQGFSGFLTPRFSSGSWNLTGYNPALCGACEWTAISYEGTPWEYSFNVPHDTKTLIQFMGGDEKFEQRLDHMMKPNTSEQDLSANGAGITSIMNIGNEPDFGTPYLYNYINKQYKSVHQTRNLTNQFFHNALYGLPGNSDAGALNSWLIWQMLGIYPIVTQPVYLLESPWFSDINMTINDHAVLRISSKGNDDPKSLGQEDYYVQSVKINGEPWKKNWFGHEDVMVKGGTIEFTVGSEPTRWEDGDAPPSPGHFVQSHN